MKRIMADTLDGMVIKDFIPDLVGLRARLRGLSDIGALSGLLVAEQAGRNDEGEPRQDALGMIIARIKAVQDNSEKVKEHSGPTEEELAEVTSAK
jgi:hypothetical protein